MSGSAQKRDNGKVHSREHGPAQDAEAEHGDGIGFDGVELEDARSARRLGGQGSNGDGVPEDTPLSQPLPSLILDYCIGGWRAHSSLSRFVKEKILKRALRQTTA